MGRIGATLSGIERTLLNRLAEANAAAVVNNLRLATLAKINYPRDDPSGFVTLSGYRARLKAVDAASTNVAAASSVAADLEQTLDLVRTQLETIRAKAVEDEDGGLTSPERTANQAAIDAAITEIDRLATSDLGGRQLLDGSADFAASGIDSDQVRELSVVSIGPAAADIASLAPTISGQVTRVATQAQLAYTGAGGLINSGAATFTLAGKLGEVSISVTNGQTLSSVATAINAQSHKTGVTASAASSTLTITTVDYGTLAEIEIDATSGTFAVTGGNGDGTANGTNAIAVLNGRTYRGNQSALPATLTHYEATGLIASNTTFTLTGNTGSAPISLAAGATLAAAATTIDAQTGATGVDAAVSADGLTLTLTSTATGNDAEVQVAVTSGTFAVSGGNGDGTANGEDAISGVTNVDGNRFMVNQNGLQFTLEFAPGHSGSFDTIALGAGGSLSFALTPELVRRETLAVPGVQAARLGGLSGTLAQLFTGGSAAGLGSNASRAIRIADEALAGLTHIEGRASGFADATVASAATLMDDFKDNLANSIDDINQVNEAEEMLLLVKNEALADNAVSALAILSQQRASIVALIQKIAGLG